MITEPRPASVNSDGYGVQGRHYLPHQETGMQTRGLSLAQIVRVTAWLAAAFLLHLILIKIGF